MVVARDTENIRKNTDTINNNKTQQQKYERKNLYLFSLIRMVRGQYQENVFPNSLTWVIDSGELFSLILILMVPLKI